MYTDDDLYKAREEGRNEAVLKAIEIIHEAIQEECSTGQCTKRFREAGFEVTQYDTQTAGLLGIMNFAAECRETIDDMVDALQPFADAVAEAEHFQSTSLRLGMGTVSDEASSGFGVLIRHFKAAKSTLDKWVAQKGGAA